MGQALLTTEEQRPPYVKRETPVLSGWAGLFANCPNYAVSYLPVFVSDDLLFYHQTARYGRIGGRFEVVEVTFAFEPAMVSQMNIEAMLKSAKRIKTLKIEGFQAWQWTIERSEKNRFEDARERLLIQLDPRKTVLFEGRGEVADLVKMASHFEFVNAARSLNRPPR